MKAKTRGSKLGKPVTMPKRKGKKILGRRPVTMPKVKPKAKGR